jgi:hypothetical protein
MAGADFTFDDQGSQWKRMIDAQVTDGDLYRDHRNFIFTKTLKIRDEGFTKYLRQNLNEVESNRARFLRLFGISHYLIVRHEVKKSPVRGFREVDVLEISYLDPDGKYRSAVERQYVRGSRAYVVTYIEETQSLSDSDFKRIDKILDQFRPNVSRVANVKWESLEKFAGLFLEPVAAEVAGESGPNSKTATSSADGSTLDISTGPLPAICKDVPIKDRRSTVRAEAVSLSDFSGCGPGAWQSLKKIGQELESLDDATTSDHLGQTLASIGSAVASRVAHPIVTSKRLIAGIYNSVKEKIKKTDQFLDCLSAKASITKLCEAAPNLAANALVGGGIGKVASEAAETLAAARIAKALDKTVVKAGSETAEGEADSASAARVGNETAATQDSEPLGSGSRDIAASPESPPPTESVAARPEARLSEPASPRIAPSDGVPMAPVASQADAATNALQKLRSESSRKGYQVRIEDGKAHIKISYMDNKDTSFIALYDAVRAGAVAEIDAGQVIGPKVPAILNRLKSVSPSGQRLVIHGQMTPGDMLYGPEFDPLSSADKAKFEKALSDLGILKACKDLFNISSLRHCRLMHFRMDSAAEDGIVWQAGADS